MHIIGMGEGRNKSAVAFVVCVYLKYNINNMQYNAYVVCCKTHNYREDARAYSRNTIEKNKKKIRKSVRVCGFKIESSPAVIRVP